MGATKLLIVGVSDNATRSKLPDGLEHSPSTAQIVGHMFNSAFIDAVESDLETLSNINRLASALPQSLREKNNITDLTRLRCCLYPPQNPSTVSPKSTYTICLRSLRIFLSLTGATAQGGGSSAASYLLFEPGFCRKLIAMGMRDALAKEDEIKQFFDTLDRLDRAKITLETSYIGALDSATF